MRVSDFVAQFIANKDISDVFTIPGGGCIHLNDAFARNKQLNVIVNHHEQACALAAEGYARLNGHLGVCLVTSGPGCSNAWTGTLCSYQDSVPVINISGNVNKNLTTNYTKLNLRQLGDQEFNAVKTVKNFTKYAVQVNDPLEIKYHLEKAYHLATTGRKGPVWIDIPLDVQSAIINPENLQEYAPEEVGDCLADIDIGLILDKLVHSKKPIIIAGHGVRLSNSTELLNLILNRFKIPVITSFNGNDSISNEYDYYCGRFGTHAQIVANNLIQEADFVLSLGSRLYVRQIGYNFKGFAKNAFKVYVDIDNEELNKPTLFPNIKVCSDVYAFLDSIKHRIEVGDIDEWRKYCRHKYLTTPTVLDRHREKSPLSVYAFIEALNPSMRPDLPIITSDGSANIVGMQVLKLKKNQRLFSNKSTAPMGYGLPAAIGACFANKKQEVVCLEGDGSLHMNIHELQVIVQNQLPIKLFVINNDGYLSIKITQKTFCNGLMSVSDRASGLSLPNYKKIARAYGIPYRSIRSSRNIKKQVKDCINTEGPVFIEVFVAPDEFHEPKVVAKLDDMGNFIPGKLNDIRWIQD
jgi:acetolactate synthase-1/2/3 large subunit